MKPEASIETVRAQAFKIPTDKPEGDGTLRWNATTLIVVEISGGGKTGLGYTYSSAVIVRLIENELFASIKGADAFNPQAGFLAMQHVVRNLGRGGLVASAISAIDAAFYDLKARLLDLPLCLMLGCYRDAIPIYGSGGFTTYSDGELEQQLGGWVAETGCAFVKMKVGSEPQRDPHRVKVAKRAIGDSTTLFVDANGAYQLKQAIALGRDFAGQGVAWFEEPVSSDDLAGLQAVRKSAPDGMEIAAGEYTFTVDDAHRLLQAAAVDVQQADVTRCGGITTFLQIADLCEAYHIGMSGHCAPAQHLHVACASPRLRHLEWFHDHVRIEQMLFEGVPLPRNGVVKPDRSRPGNGLTFKHKDAARYALGTTA